LTSGYRPDDDTTASRRSQTRPSVPPDEQPPHTLHRTGQPVRIYALKLNPRHSARKLKLTGEPATTFESFVRDHQHVWSLNRAAHRR